MGKQRSAPDFGVGRGGNVKSPQQYELARLFEGRGKTSWPHGVALNPRRGWGLAASLCEHMV